MREIKFRAKTYEDRFYPDLAPSKWVFGFLVMFPNESAWMHTSPKNQVIVQPKTIGQFTGFHDKNGKEIYFGDIVRSKYGDIGSVIWFSDWSLRVDWGGGDIHFIDLDLELEVIGNVYDNPELLNDKNE